GPGDQIEAAAEIEAIETPPLGEGRGEAVKVGGRVRATHPPAIEAQNAKRLAFRHHRPLRRRLMAARSRSSCDPRCGTLAPGGEAGVASRPSRPSAPRRYGRHAAP